MADITTRFNAACYGGVASEIRHIEALRGQLTTAITALDTKAQEAEAGA